MSMRKGICKTCGWYGTDGCGYGVVDRYRGIKEPCGWWKRKRRKKRGRKVAHDGS